MLMNYIILAGLVACVIAYTYVNRNKYFLSVESAAKSACTQLNKQYEGILRFNLSYNTITAVSFESVSTSLFYIQILDLSTSWYKYRIYTSSNRELYTNSVVELRNFIIKHANDVVEDEFGINYDEYQKHGKRV